MKFHYQVTIMDKQDYIIEYRNFAWSEIDLMLAYIRVFFNHEVAHNIRITRWNEDYERA